MDGGTSKIGSKRQGRKPVERLGPGWSTRLEEARLRRVAALAARKVTSPKTDTAKPWDAAVEKAAPKLVDEARVNLRSAARMKPKPSSVDPGDSVSEERLDRALAAVGTGMTRNASFPERGTRVAPASVNRRRGWGVLAAGIFLLSASALTYGLVQSSTSGADWLPAILTQGGPDAPTPEPSQPVAVGEAPVSSVADATGPDAASVPADVFQSPLELASGGVASVEAAAPSLGEAPGSAPGNVLPADVLAAPTPGEIVPAAPGEVGPDLLAMLSEAPASNDLIDADAATPLPAVEGGPATGAAPSALAARSAARETPLSDVASLEAPAPFEVAAATQPGPGSGEATAPDLSAPSGVQTEAPVALALGSGTDVAPPVFGSSEGTSRDAASAALALPEAGPPAFVEGFGEGAGPELALLFAEEAVPLASAPRVDDTVNAPVLSLAAPSAPQGIGARPDLQSATEPPAALERSAPIPDDGPRLVMHAPRSVTETGLAEAAEAVSAATGFGVETRPLVEFSISSSNVRYFHPEDRESASVVANALSARLRDFTDFEPAPPEGTIEVWLSGASDGSQPAPAVAQQSRPAAAAPGTSAVPACRASRGSATGVPDLHDNADAIWGPTPIRAVTDRLRAAPFR